MSTLGVDTGGTFTDLVLIDGDEVRVAKVPSTPANPADAVLAGIAALGGVDGDDHVIHGTTVALNALLTGNVARCAFVTNAGFRDLIEIGRQERPDIYALEPVRPAPLVPRELRFEIPQRSWPDAESGELVEVESPSAEDWERLTRALSASGAETVAIGLLHSFADPSLESAVAARLEGLGLPVTCSSELLPEHREFERYSTAVVNASLVPRMRAYLEPLAKRLSGARLSILQSSGGSLPAERACDEPVRVLLSGPAGGVIGAARAAAECGLERIVTLDMGGTSTDVAFHDARPAHAGESDAEASDARSVEPVHVGGHPVGVPSLDIHTIGCGGGSLVHVDAGGVMHVGPQSAGADPGPVCYGASTELTVTDAHVFLGHVHKRAFLGGTMELDNDAVATAFEKLGSQLGVTARVAARGVLEVARAAMRRALGVKTMQRGLDPAALPLVAFGGAGGLHAAALAKGLGMPCALVPRDPGVLSAWGMVASGAQHDETETILEPLERWSVSKRKKHARELAARGRAMLRAAGHRARDIRFEHHVDVRYAGQSFELRLSDCADLATAFHRAHAELYGYSLPERSVELVCLRARALVGTPTPAPAPPRSKRLPKHAILGTARVDFGRLVTAQRIDRSALQPGHRFAGPARVEEYSGTTLVPPGFDARVAAGGHLILESTP